MHDVFALLVSSLDLCHPQGTGHYHGRIYSLTKSTACPLVSLALELCMDAASGFPSTGSALVQNEH